MSTINKITSVTSHVTGEGQRLSYTYSVIDGSSGAVISDNNRESLVVIEGITENDTVLVHIRAIEDYIKGKMEG